MRHRVFVKLSCLVIRLCRDSFVNDHFTCIHFILLLLDAFYCLRIDTLIHLFEILVFGSCVISILNSFSLTSNYHLSKSRCILLAMPCLNSLFVLLCQTIIIFEQLLLCYCLFQPFVTAGLNFLSARYDNQLQSFCYY